MRHLIVIVLFDIRRPCKGAALTLLTAVPMPTNADQISLLAKGVFPDLSVAEEDFLRRNAVGEYPIFGTGTSEIDKPENANQWGPERTIRADCLRWLCSAQNIRPFLQTSHIRAVGIKVTGQLVLNYCVIPFLLGFDRCCFTDWITFEKSRLGGLELKGTHLKKSIHGPGIVVASSVHIWNESAVEGCLYFDGATISGDLRCDKITLVYKKWPEDTELNNPSNEAFRGAQIEVKGFVSFIGSKVNGGVSLYEARIQSALRCEGAEFLNKGMTALLCTGATFGGAVYLDEKFVAKGTVDFNFARIGGELTCRGSHFEQTEKAVPSEDTRPALSLEYGQVTGNVILKNGFVCSGVLSLQAATIGGHLDCENGQFSNAHPHNILANNAKITGGVLLRNGFRSEGTIRFFGATIGGNVECNGTLSPGEDGVALDLQRVQIGGHILFGSNLVLKGNTKFQSAQIAGNVRFDGGVAQNPGGNCIELAYAKIEGSVTFINHFKSEGSVNLTRSRIGGDLELLEAEFIRAIEPLPQAPTYFFGLQADYIRVEGLLRIGTVQLGKTELLFAGLPRGICFYSKALRLMEI
jgi:hypothetical protein